MLDAALHGDNRDLGPVGDVELRKAVGDVPFHRRFRLVQRGGDLIVTAPRDDGLQPRSLALCEGFADSLMLPPGMPITLGAGLQSLAARHVEPTRFLPSPRP